MIKKGSPVQKASINVQFGDCYMYVALPVCGQVVSAARTCDHQVARQCLTIAQWLILFCIALCIWKQIIWCIKMLRFSRILLSVFRFFMGRDCFLWPLNDALSMVTLNMYPWQLSEGLRISSFLFVFCDFVSDRCLTLSFLSFSFYVFLFFFFTLSFHLSVTFPSFWYDPREIDLGGSYCQEKSTRLSWCLCGDVWDEYLKFIIKSVSMMFFLSCHCFLLFSPGGIDDEFDDILWFMIQ